MGKFRLRLLEQEFDRIHLRARTLGELPLENFDPLKGTGLFELRIERQGNNPVRIGFIRFRAREGYSNIQAIGSGGGSKSEAKRFFEIFGQYPFRLVQFAALTVAKKAGFDFFSSDSGSRDIGIWHALQQNEGLFSHVVKEDSVGLGLHRIKSVPNLSLTELQSLLARGLPVPQAFLHPQSHLIAQRLQRERAFRRQTLLQKRRQTLGAKRKLK